MIIVFSPKFLNLISKIILILCTEKSIFKKAAVDKPFMEGNPYIPINQIGSMRGMPKPFTVKILKFGTPQTIAIIVLKIEKFDVTLQ